MHIKEIDSIETVEEYNNDIESALIIFPKGILLPRKKPEVFQKIGIENNFKLAPIAVKILF